MNEMTAASSGACSGSHLPGSSSRLYLSYQPGSLLIDLAARLSPRVWRDRSFALRSGKIYANRFCLTVDMVDISANAHEKILDSCRQLRMAEAQIEQVNQHLSKTRFVSLGFEQGIKANVYKVYLQQRTPTGEPSSEHFGFKWDAADPSRHVMTRYTWYPGLSLPQIQGRVADTFAQARAGAVDIAQGLIDFAGTSAAKKSALDVVFVTVDEPGNVRRSFDLNFYRAGLRVADIAPFLHRMWHHYGIAKEKWEPVYESACNETFGHFSGGIHRDGEDFFTVYYGRKLILGRPKRFFRRRRNSPANLPAAGVKAPPA